jgi:hypothetical protein
LELHERLYTLSEQPLWSRDLRLQNTRTLNNHLHDIATLAGLDHDKVHAFDKYSRDERQRTPDKVLSLVPAQCCAEGLFGITKAMTVFVGAVAKKRERFLQVAGSQVSRAPWKG